MFNDLSSPRAFLATRRSGKPRDMVAPGPDAAQLADILSIATRTPDHGKLAPWRFLTIPDDRRDAFAAMLRDAYLEEKPEAGRLELEAIDQFARQAPTLVVVISRPAHASHIPIWEQELSAGAVCMNLGHAAHAHGFVAGWLTGWAAYSPAVCKALAADDGRIAGFVFIGTPSRPLDERPRPDIAAVVHPWEG
ncbi:nitroreductase family protein [Sphingomonas solaris]|uniref:Putative NAD(P)H nitroreductase n=1 Tax=Alterirhizorhabdus solaris TaxID=2529389 RepID=A0A558R6F0_9SPHN|nr:nitroreductase [Sphingomonas solaris]TVV74898.1 nitroreductase [Sphingomonas solaris]